MLANKTLTQLSDHLVQAFPVMDKLEQNIALIIYRLLAEGSAVSKITISKVSGQSIDSVEKTIQTWTEIIYDNENNITDFLGLSIKETRHRLNIDATTVYTWCAWDTLFIAELINKPINVHSVCPVTNKNIQLDVSIDGVKPINNENIMVSFLKPNKSKLNKNIQASFCCYVFFFFNRKAGERWLIEHDDAFLLSLDEAFTVGKKFNAARYNLVLT